MAAAGIGTRTGFSVLGPGPPENVEELSIETMAILLEAGADVNARITDTTSLTARIARGSTVSDREGQTTLFFAVQQGRVPVVDFLLEHGAAVDVVDQAGRTLLDVAGDGSEETVALLQNAGLKP
jgi:ankyrin repeat protein